MGPSGPMLAACVFKEPREEGVFKSTPQAAGFFTHFLRSGAAAGCADSHTRTHVGEKKTEEGKGPRPPLARVGFCKGSKRARCVWPLPLMNAPAVVTLLGGLKVKLHPAL